jgi:pyruvate kinase
MQKYIAVVNPRMDEDEISKLIAQGIAGALFEISHQNYPMAAKLISLIKKLAKKYNRPISILQDVSSMEDPLDLEFGMKSGADWIVTDQDKHLKMAKGLNKLAQVIYKGRNLPKGIRVDSVMADSFLDPDAVVLNRKKGQIKHLISEHKDQKVLDSILDISHHAGTSAIAVSDFDLAKALSFRRPSRRIIFIPGNDTLASQAAIFWGVHPVFGKKTFATERKGQRVVDATDMKHVRIHLVP